MEKKMETTIMGSTGGCQNDGPFLGTLNIRIIGTILGFYGDNGKENGNLPFWVPKYSVPYYNRDPKKGP